MILLSALRRWCHDLANPPRVPVAVARNLIVAQRAQAIAEELKYQVPDLNAEILTAAARMLDVPVAPVHRVMPEEACR